jgi:4-amino-4-deoxy-L-arabinose transferase-like glycosyltransferase
VTDVAVTRPRSLYRPALVAYFVARLLVLVSSAITNPFTHTGFVAQLTRWDGAWYLRAVYWGWPTHLTYVHGLATGTDLAFFPVLPLLIRLVSDITFLAPSIAGLLISGLSGATAVLAVTRLARDIKGDDVARRAGLLFALFPGTFVFSFIYCEGLLITFAALALIYLRKAQWWRAGLIMALATATSPAALPLCVVALWASAAAIRRARDWRSLAALALSPFGFVLWFAYLWHHTHVFDAWQRTESGGWHSHPSWRYPFHIVANFLFNPAQPDLTDHMLFWGTVIAVIGIVFSIRQHLGGVVLIYLVTSVLLAAISSPIGLRPRFLTIAFPLAIGYASACRGRTYRFVLALSVIFLGLMTFETMYSWAIFP